MKTAFPGGVKKALTFSFDDGVVQDRRVIALMDRYHLKGTFNLCSGRFGLTDSITYLGKTADTSTIKESEVRAVYAGHEIAGHTVHHPLLTDCTNEEVIAEIEHDRQKLSELAGYEVCGFAFPNPWEKIKDFTELSALAAKTGVRYARTTAVTDSFEPARDVYSIGMTARLSAFERAFPLAEAFLALETDTPKVFYLMAHAYEFDLFDSWDKLEKLFELLAGHDDIFYGTNREVYLD